MWTLQSFTTTKGKYNVIRKFKKESFNRYR